MDHTQTFFVCLSFVCRYQEINLEKLIYVSESSICNEDKLEDGKIHFLFTLFEW